jgi:hypothetical protein
MVDTVDWDDKALEIRAIYNILKLDKARETTNDKRRFNPKKLQGLPSWSPSYVLLLKLTAESV